MADTSKEKTTNVGSEPETPDFELALKQLEEIVDAMESGDVPLDELVQRFEDGAKLVQICRKALDQAELKIETLKQNFSEFEPLTIDETARD